MAVSNLKERYFRRLGLELNLLDDKKLTPFGLLCRLTEAHCSRIPFGNIGQHGGRTPASKADDLESMAKKLLDDGCGGVCFEVNVLFGELLRELKIFPSVTTVLATVHADDVGFNRPNSHVITMVEAADGANDKKGAVTSTYYVDVGLGEPSIHPIKYTTKKAETCPNLYEAEQITVEGMNSRLVREESADANRIVLQWSKDGMWKPRLRWEWKDSIERNAIPSAKELQDIYDVTHHPASKFSTKLIVCRVTRDAKTSLTGTALRITGPPRFPTKEIPEVPLVVEPMDSLESVRQALWEKFNVPLSETEHLHIEALRRQDSSQWI